MADKRTRATLRGQPLYVLVALIFAWACVRGLMWQPVPGDPLSNGYSEGTGPIVAETAPSPSPLDSHGTPAGPGTPARDYAPPYAPPVEVLPPPAWHPDDAYSPSVPWLTEEQQPKASLRPHMAAGHSLLLMSALSRMGTPSGAAALMGLPGAGAKQPPLMAAVPPSGVLRTEVQGSDRWSADAWLLLRRDTTTSVTSGRGSYGQSQIGAVIRYQIKPSSRHQPAAYVRGSKALAGAKEAEIAAGLSARPIPSVPVVAAAEMRLTQQGGQTRTRPAVYAYTQLPPADLPFDLRGEAYAQAGYVGGDFATAFVDGQVRVDRKVAQVSTMEVRAGGGVWGGAQKGAARLDIGPSASVQIDLGGAPSRLSMDWRFRVAGQAEPSSGPALTISAGF